uniref:NADH-ubiquinone oxidoreductase chain 1 n=1 Tax=Psyttalia lounsburyi TaxID=405760 RepID=A0A8A4JCS0_9HYME|nr:NADH dehydrogenase subunit 1 [Psyttalia lounsburyi]
MKQLYIYMMNTIILMLMIIMMMMISVAFSTLFERKILSYMHYRKGPNKVSMWGLLQPFSDAMKLMSKEFFFPKVSNYNFYYISPMIMLILIMMLWLIYPFKMNLYNWNLNSMYMLCLMSMGVYGLMIAGWSSNSCFSMLGGMRSIAQSISYEVIFSITFLLNLLMINSLSLNMLFIYQKYTWLLILMWPTSMLLLMSMLAELNRTPFDLSEGESELVSGFNIEYSSHGFVLIFLSEYSSIMFMMFIFNLMYMGSNLFSLMFYFSLMMLIFFIFWTRITLPRIRYDLLMYFCWIYLLPIILILFMYFIMFKSLIEILFFM